MLPTQTMLDFLIELGNCLTPPSQLPGLVLSLKQNTERSMVSNNTRMTPIVYINDMQHATDATIAYAPAVATNNYRLHSK